MRITSPAKNMKANFNTHRLLVVIKRFNSKKYIIKIKTKIGGHVIIARMINARFPLIYNEDIRRKIIEIASGNTVKKCNEIVDINDTNGPNGPNEIPIINNNVKNMNIERLSNPKYELKT